jgi:hypothetical protein
MLRSTGNDGYYYQRNGVKIGTSYPDRAQVEIGEKNGNEGQVGFAGSTKIGRHACSEGSWVCGHLRLLTGQKSEPSQVSRVGCCQIEQLRPFGLSCISRSQGLLQLHYFQKVPEINSKIERMAKDIDLLKKNIETDK